jgi:hypothetical protein
MLVVEVVVETMDHDHQVVLVAVVQVMFRMLLEMLQLMAPEAVVEVEVVIMVLPVVMVVMEFSLSNTLPHNHHVTFRKIRRKQFSFSSSHII